MIEDLPLARARMHDRLAGLGLAPGLLAAIAALPRHEFVPPPYRRLAYAEPGLWLPNGTALPSPELTARILAGLDPAAGDRLLEIGTATGYLAALLGSLCAEIVTFDTTDCTHGALADIANVRYWIDPNETFRQPAAPFDAILISRPVPALPLQWLTHAPRLLAVVGPETGPQRLLLARREPLRVTDFGPLIVPSPAMARAVHAGGPSPIPALEGSALEGPRP
jgi:protein-L-isoaspartate(D-aspartate) O-methyltransferase